MDVSSVPLPVTVLIVFAAARLFSEIFERLKQPGIVGEILAGVVIGPALLGWISPNDVTRTLSELGVMFLLFRVGLETKASELMKVGGVATAVAISGVIIPLIAGYGIATAWGSPFPEAMFTGAAFVATSVGITAQVLANKGVLRARSSQIILAAAVIDDVLGLIVLAIVSGAVRKQLRFLDLAITALLPMCLRSSSQSGAPLPSGTQHRESRSASSMPKPSSTLRCWSCLRWPQQRSMLASQP